MTPTPTASRPWRHGVSIPFAGVPLRDHRARLEELETLGYDEVWTGEGGAHDAFTPLALAAAWAPSLRLAAGIIPAFTRGPALIAQTAASMCDAAPGRFVLGLGSSSKVLVEDWNDGRLERPLARLRDLVRFLRVAFTGDKVSEQYETFGVRNFKLGVAVAEPPPLLLAALRPRMIELAGTEADGVILNWMSIDDIAGLTLPAGKEAVARIKVVASSDRATIRAYATRISNVYLHVAAYRQAQEWLGRGEALLPFWDAWAAGERRLASDLLPDEVIDELFLWGEPDRIRAGIEAYAAAGATSVVPAIYGSPDEVWDTIRALAPARHETAPGGDR